MVEEYRRIRNEALAKIDEEVTDPDALFDVKQFLSTDEARRKAAMRLANDSSSPVVSKETQIAFFKQMIQDFMRGKKRPGLSALTAMKAGELINKMCGYDAPEKQEITHEHKVTALPVISAPFKGDLPILKVQDIGDENGAITSIAVGDVSPENSDLTLF